MTKFRNQALEQRLKVVAKAPAKKRKAAVIKKPNTVNTQGHEAYKLDKWLKLLSILNTVKLENQFYRNETETVKEVKELVKQCANQDPYLTAQCIVYSRCVGEGMRSVSHLASTELGRYIAGQEWGKRFYSLWNKKAEKGGVIFRPDDIAEIVACYTVYNPKTVTKRGKSVIKNIAITNAMKKGFKDALERMDAYSLLKYKSALLDVINIVRPNPKASKATVLYGKKKVSVFEAIIKGYSVSADTHEVANSEAGQMVAEAVRTGKITKTEAKKILVEAKADNWKSLLADGKLPIMAALRNIRNILLNNPDKETVDMLCDILCQKDKILQGKIMPYQLDLANEVVNSEFKTMEGRRISKVLTDVYETSVPNLKEVLSGRTLVMVDMSGSMADSNSYITNGNASDRKTYVSMARDKAALIAATIAKAVNADIILFGSEAKTFNYNLNYNLNLDVFSLGRSMVRNMGGTSLSSAWNQAARQGKRYDRVIILSDNECNKGSVYTAYNSYVEKVGNPWVYSVDLAAYGTTAIAGPKVKYYYGYGFSMFEDIVACEFNPNYHLDKVRKIVI